MQCLGRLPLLLGIPMYVFFSMIHYPDPPFGNEKWERKLPIQNRFNIQYFEDAPHIVHACGLDPNVATVEDMDRLNARLKCLVCNIPYINSSRDAVSLPDDRIQ